MENRKHRRYAVRLPVALSSERVTGEGVVSNLSREGCTIEAECPLHVGVNVALSILMPDRYSPMLVDVAAVRWTSGQRFGMEFLHMRPEQVVKLGRVVKDNPPTPPSTAS